MAIRLADTARPNNYVDAEHLGTYPVAYADDVWFEDGTRLSEKTFDGTSIQKEELPLASAAEAGNIYQYVGTDGTYKNGYFYKCVENDSNYIWSQLKVSPDTAVKYVNELPSSGNIEDLIYAIKSESHSIDCDNVLPDTLRAQLIANGFSISDTPVDTYKYQMTYPTPLAIYITDIGQWILPNEYTTLYFYTYNPSEIEMIKVNGNAEYFNNQHNLAFVYRELDLDEYYVGNSEMQILTELKTGGSSEAIIDVETLPTLNIKNTFYRIVRDNTQEHTVDYTQEVSYAKADEYAQSFSDFLTENNITHNLRLRGNTDNTSRVYNIAQPLYLDTDNIQLKDKPIVEVRFYKSDFALGYMAIETSDTEVTFTDSGLLFTFYVGEIWNEYYAGSEDNQSLERMAAYADMPDVSKKPNTFTGTQAEWDALTANEKAQYVIANITDDDAGENLEYYSTEETKTNKVWIDGKPIYRKVYKCTAATSLTAGEDWKNIPGWDVNVSGIATITYLFGSIYYWGRIDWYKYTNNKLLWCSLNSTITVPVDAALTIEYTKL